MKTDDKKFCGLCRDEAVITYVYGLIEDLIDKGMLDGPKVLTEKGRGVLAELRAIGFKATNEEIEWAMRAINNPAGCPAEKDV